MTRRPLMKKGGRWAIILSGGEGDRLRAFTISRFGEHRPKQYCAFLGERTMFDHTLRRAVEAVGRRRIVTVIGRGHGRFLYPRRSELCGFVLEQPRNCDTAAGILLPLTTVLAYDPDATVMIFPSDHYIRPNAAFHQSMSSAAALAERLEDRLVLAAAVADEPETEYGWIQPGRLVNRCGTSQARQVLAFHEKPAAHDARRFFADGCLWNTFIMAARARVIWDLAAAHHPALMERFAVLRKVVGGPRESAVLGDIYKEMPQVNFSRGILERATERSVVMPMEGVEWNDWGRPERIERTLESLETAVPSGIEVSGSYAAAGV